MLHLLYDLPIYKMYTYDEDTKISNVFGFHWVNKLSIKDNDNDDDDDINNNNNNKYIDIMGLWTEDEIKKNG